MVDELLAGTTEVEQELVGLRSEIEALRSSGKSLMPEGIEKDLSPQNVADLIEYVRNLSAPK